MTDRRNTFPPSNIVAELIWHWKLTWPKAELNSDTVAKIYPYIVEKWQEGWSVPQIAQTACSCDDGLNISPSPVALRQLPKRRLALPPPTAEPGTIFGASDLRDVPTVAKLKLQSDVAELSAKELGVKVEILYKRLSVASDASKPAIEAQIAKLVAKQAELRKQQADAQQRLVTLQSTGKLPAKPGAPRKPAASAPAQPSPAQAPKPKAPKAPRKKPPTPSAAVPAPAAPSATPSAGDVNATEDLIAQLFKDGG